MARAFGRIKCARLFDLLVVSLVGANVLYVVYHWSKNTSSGLPFTGEDGVDLAAVRTRKSVKSQLRVALKDVMAAQPDDEPAPTAQIVARPIVNGTNPCPETPPNLIGDLACNCDKVSAEFLAAQYQNMELGGRLRPLHCKPGQRLALIIPYRDRYDHLHTLLNMLIPILSRQQADVTFFVVEQTNETYFNRAALQNVGFLEALKVGEFDCFIFHDVDLVPLNDFHLYRCGPNPIHFTSKIQSTQWTATKEMYKEYTGGVIAFTRQQYQTLNGNSNLYFGWGGEDDDLYERILNKKMVRVRANKAWALYQMLQHARQEVKGENPQRFEVLKTARQRQDIEGLNSCKYTVNSIQQKRLYTWINVSLNNTEILKTAPSYTLKDIIAVLKKVARAPGVDMTQANTAANGTLENQHTPPRETASSIQGEHNNGAPAR